MINSISPTFQFHYGAIKSFHIDWINKVIDKFQFHYGAIKRALNVAIAAMPFDFNSTMVRLKESIVVMVPAGPSVFQFHYGAIKRPLNVAYSFDASQFQFHYGAIKRSNHRKKMVIVYQFQFHYGAIKRRWNNDIKKPVVKAFIYRKYNFYP